MKKTYYSSAVLPIFSFVGFSLALFFVMYIQDNFAGNEISYLQGVAVAGIFCFIAWISLIIRVENNQITRRLFLFFISTHKLTEVKEILNISEKDALGKNSYTQILFKNGEKWNITMFNKKDIEEIKKCIG